MIEEMLDGRAQPGIPTPPPTTQDTQEITKLECLVYEALNSPAGKDLISALEKKFLLNTTWLPGAPEGYAQFRAGQNDIVAFLRNSFFKGNEGKLAPAQGTNNQ